MQVIDGLVGLPVGPLLGVTALFSHFQYLCVVLCMLQMLCRSDEHGQAALGNLADSSDLKKLDRETFARAPRKVMEGTLALIR